MDTSIHSILFITGLSGAGISTALKSLEDCGYEVFDNFPVSHIHALVNEDTSQSKAMAFGLDTRTRGFNPDKIVMLAKDLGARIIFLNATNAKLQQRFSETRRVHPLARDRMVVDGIIHERQILESLIDNADRLIDTTDLSVHDLKHIFNTDFSPTAQENRLAVSVMSFAYKKGVPREVDMVLDVRFLKNPHWEESLRDKTGQDSDVQAYIESDPNFKIYLQKISKDIEWLLPRYAHEGKSYFTIAFGCTGGKHRSVYLAERLGGFIKELDYPVTVRHRDMPRP